jgi:hypothetical protein
MALEEIGGHELLARELRAVERRTRRSRCSWAREVKGAARFRRPRAGPALRIPHAAEEPRIHAGRDAGAGARHRREYGHFQRGQRRAPAAAGLSRPRPAADDLRTTPEFSRSSVAYPNYLDWRRASRSFTGMGAVRGDDFNFTGSGEPEQASRASTSRRASSRLGVTPFLGRSFLPEEDRQGALHGHAQLRFWKAAWEPTRTSSARR